MTISIAAHMPFVWPEPRVSAGVGAYVTELPFEDAARKAICVSAWCPQSMPTYRLKEEVLAALSELEDNGLNAILRAVA